MRIISNLVGRLDWPSRCPGKKAGAEAKKGREQSFPMPPLSFPQRDAGGKGWPNCKRRKPASRMEGPLPFLARRMLFCPGMGPLAIGYFFYLKNPLKT